MQTQKQGLLNFSQNIKSTMLKIKDAQAKGYGKAAKLDYSEQQNILNYYLEVCDYLSKQS